jgi:hypothetical protein
MGGTQLGHDGEANEHCIASYRDLRSIMCGKYTQLVAVIAEGF